LPKDRRFGLSKPITCDLPDFRVIGGRTFLTAGVDFAGPVFVKDVYSRDTMMHNAYIALATCVTSRMVNLEPMPDLSTPAYIRAQQRFIARRGYPEMIVSDNGRTFRVKELIYSMQTITTNGDSTYLRLRGGVECSKDCQICQKMPEESYWRQVTEL